MGRRCCLSFESACVPRTKRHKQATDPDHKQPHNQLRAGLILGRRIMPSPLPAGAAIDGNNGEREEEEEGEMLLLAPPLGPESPPAAVATSPAARTQEPPQQQIRWDRIVSAGLGVMGTSSINHPTPPLESRIETWSTIAFMRVSVHQPSQTFNPPFPLPSTALVSLLFVATDSSVLLFFVPRPTDGGASRVRARDAAGPSGAGASGTHPSPFYTTVSYKDEVSKHCRLGGWIEKKMQPRTRFYTYTIRIPNGITRHPNATAACPPATIRC